MKSSEGLFRIKTCLKQSLMIVSLFFGLKEIENFRQDNMRDVE